MNPEIVLICGLPASGKSTLAEKYDPTCEVLNRDSVGGAVNQLVPRAEQVLRQGKSVVLDNLHATKKSRQPFIKLAKKLGVNIVCEWQNTPAEQCHIHALNRMWERYGTIFWTKKEINQHPKAKKDPNIFPIVVIFKYKKEFEKPTKEEGFALINKSKPEVVWPKEYTNRAILLDYDETLRTVVNGKQKYPVSVDEVKLLPNRRDRLVALQKAGYCLLGVSNQSGIARGDVSHKNAVACFEKTNELLDLDIDYHFCPHGVPPICYCRKPQSGIGVYLIHKYKLNPSKCIFIGDQTSDRTFAKRLGMKYYYPDEFFFKEDPKSDSD